MSDPKQYRMQTRAAIGARLFLAAVVASSFLISFAPLGTASSEEIGLMDCCVGKAGHEGGSCSSGILTSSAETQHETSNETEGSNDSILVVADGGIHAQSDEESVAPETPPAEHPQVAAITRTCAGECATCSTSFNRQPRPREQSTLATKAGGHLQISSRLRAAVDPLCITLPSVTTHLRPRAPPLSV